MKYKRYIVFGVDSYSSHGGMGDALDSFDCPIETLIFCREAEKVYDYVSVFDCEEREELTDGIFVDVNKLTKEQRKKLPDVDFNKIERFNK
jgi:hypothetical protein